MVWAIAKTGGGNLFLVEFFVCFVKIWRKTNKKINSWITAWIMVYFTSVSPYPEYLQSSIFHRSVLCGNGAYLNQSLQGLV